MRSKAMLLWVSALPCLVFAASTPIGQADTANAAGVFWLVTVNGHQLPAVSWTVDRQGRSCVTETLGGALLLGSNGRWAGLVTEQTGCPTPAGLGSNVPPVSEVHGGSFAITGNAVTFHDEGLDLTSRASLKKNVLTWTVIGLDRHQTSEFVLKKLPYVWSSLARPADAVGR